MSDISFSVTIPWWGYFFIPPFGLTEEIGLGTIPLAVAVAAAWLWLGRRVEDRLLVAIAAISALGSIFGFYGPGFPTIGRLLMVAAANFIWFALLLWPLRWLLRRWTARARPS
jgi:hypothetical protein